jgi:hypothetical protein
MERNLLKSVSLAWLVLALLVAPVRVLASPDQSGCAMSDAHQLDSAGHHHTQSSNVDPGAGHCPQCVQPGCGDAGCHDPGCCVFHLTPGLTGGPLLFRIAVPDAYTASAAEKRASLPLSPPFRPPV